MQVNPGIVAELESHGMTFVGHDVDAQRMEIMELQGCQQHALLPFLLVEITVRGHCRLYHLRYFVTRIEL